MTIPVWITKGRALLYSSLSLAAIALTVLVGYWSCGSKVMANATAYVDTRAKAVADTEINKALRPLEKMVFNQSLLQMKTNDYLETTFSSAELAKARAVWIRDSVTLVNQLLQLGFRR